MPPLTDPEILARYKSALSNWRVTGYVEWKDMAWEWAHKNLKVFSQKDLAELMYKHVEGGGEIDQVKETRPEWNDFDFHYDLRVPIGGRLRYFETLLVDGDPDDPIILVVNTHDA